SSLPLTPTAASDIRARPPLQGAEHGVLPATADFTPLLPANTGQADGRLHLEYAITLCPSHSDHGPGQRLGSFHLIDPLDHRRMPAHIELEVHLIAGLDASQLARVRLKSHRHSRPSESGDRMMRDRDPGSGRIDLNDLASRVTQLLLLGARGITHLHSRHAHTVLGLGSRRGDRDERGRDQRSQDRQFLHGHYTFIDGLLSKYVARGHRGSLRAPSAADSPESVPRRSACSLSMVNRTGTSTMTERVEVIMPPTMGAAMGFMTSEPIPVSQRSGARLPSTANTVISTGRRRRTAPSMAAASISSAAS